MAPSKPIIVPEIRKFWWCSGQTGCGHVVGEIVWKKLDAGSKVRALLVYEQSTETPPDEQPYIRATVMMGCDMKCSICRTKYQWWPNQEAFDRLMRHYSKK